MSESPMHTPMTLWLVWQYWTEQKSVITLVKNEKLASEANKLAQDLCEIALAVSERSDKDVSDSSLIEASEEQESMQYMFEKLEVKPLGKKRMLGALVSACIDYCAYLYKTFVFLRSGRYVLGTFVLIAFVECLFMLLVRGHLLRFPAALRTSLTVGLPTIDFLQVVHFKGLFGFPYLFVSIYGLPLTGIRTWPSTLLAMLFLLNGTRTLAQFVVGAVDMDTYDINDGEKELTEFFEYMAILSDVEEGESSEYEPFSARDVILSERRER